MSHALHFDKYPDEEWPDYEQRRLSALEGAKGSGIYEVILDVIEAEYRYQYEKAYMAADQEEAWLAIRVARGIGDLYDVIVRASSQKLKDTARAESHGRMISRQAELRVQDRLRSLARHVPKG